MSDLQFEAVHDVLNVGAGQRLSEAQLFGEVDLVVEFVQLLQELLLRHRSVQDGPATTTRDGVGPTRLHIYKCVLVAHLRDHGAGHHQLVHQLAEVAAHRLPVLQPHVHADRLLLQSLDLTADGGQVALEAAQHALHPLTGGRRGFGVLFHTDSSCVVTHQVLNSFL